MIRITEDNLAVSLEDKIKAADSFRSTAKEAKDKILEAFVAHIGN